MKQIDLTVELIDLCDSDNETAEPVQHQPRSQKILSSDNTSQHTNRSALCNLRHPSSNGSHRTAQANISSAAAQWSEPAQQMLPAEGFPLEPGQQVMAASELPARQPGTASKADRQLSVSSTAGRNFLSSGSIGAESTLPAAYPAAQTFLPPPAASPLATFRPPLQSSAHQVAGTQPTSQAPAASSQQEAPPVGAQPPVSSPDRGRQHPSPLLRDLHAQRQAAAKTQATAAQGVQQIVQDAQQAAQPHAASPIKQTARQVMASQQAAQGPATSRGTKGQCLHHAKFRHS